MTSKEWTDAELVDYIDSHSRTDLALVANAHVRRFLKIAGEEMPAHLEHVGFISCKHYNISELLAAARRRMASGEAKEEPPAPGPGPGGPTSPEG